MFQAGLKNYQPTSTPHDNRLQRIYTPADLTSLGESTVNIPEEALERFLASTLSIDETSSIGSGASDFSETLSAYRNASRTTNKRVQELRDYDSMSQGSGHDSLGGGSSRKLNGVRFLWDHYWILLGYF